MKSARKLCVRLACAGLAMSGLFAAVSVTGWNAPAVASAPAPQAASRALGASALRFVNPLVATDFDMGDAFFGSTITRYVSATGGVRPYGFASGNLDALVGAGSTLTLSNSGCATGTVNANTVTNVPGGLQFQVTVGDSHSGTANILTRNFRLNLFTPGAQIFRFAQDRLPNGVQGGSYLSKVDVLGGKNAVTFSVVPGSVALNGQVLGTGDTLEPLGLALTDNGTIFGRPLLVGVVTFSVHATDTLKRTAKDRSNVNNDQVISLTVEDNQIITSDFTTLSCRVTGNAGEVNRDTFHITGIMNFGGVISTTLRGSRISFYLGSSAFEGFLDTDGNIVNARGSTLVLNDGSQVTGSIKTLGGPIDIKVTKANIGTGINARGIVDRSVKRIPFAINVFDFVLGADLIDFSARKAGDSFSLDYKNGKTGRLVGGAFQLLSVHGSDKYTVSGLEGDSWNVRFLAIPRFGLDATAGLDNINSIGVNIGTSPRQALPASSLKRQKNGNLSLSGPEQGGEIVSKMTYNVSSYAGEVTSKVLSIDRTGLRQAKNSAALPIDAFEFGFDIDRISGGDMNCEGAKRIRSTKNNLTWVDRDSLQK